VPNLRHNKSQAGFGFLEALISLALFSAVGIVGIAWLQQSLSTSVKMQQSLEQSRLRQLMLDTITSINLSERSSGNIRIGEYTVEWNATPLGRSQSQIGYPQGMGLHRVQLFEVSVVARHQQDTQRILRQTLQQLGHIPQSRAPEHERDTPEQQLHQLPQFLR
jgi:hypothetical protein